LFYRQSSQETAEYVQRKLDFTSGFARSETIHGPDRRSEAQSEHAVPLMAAYEIRQMAKTRVLGFHRDLPPFRAGRMDWRRFPELLARRGFTPPKLSPLLPLPTDTASGAGEPKAPPRYWQVNAELFRTRIRPEQLNEATP
jgi:type IV secretory pathway TraG/TraD family ATPase VirD4